jgi:hypothetical protein
MNAWSSMVAKVHHHFTPSGRRKGRPERQARQRQKAGQSQRIAKGRAIADGKAADWGMGG